MRCSEDTRYTWEDGWVASMAISRDGSTLAELTEYDHDDDGNIIDGRVDSDGDGVWDWAYGHAYQDGTYVGYWYDVGFDGDFETEYRYTLDADHNVIEAWKDSDGDGLPNTHEFYTWLGGNLQGYTGDYDGDGSFEVTAVLTWNGNQLQEELVTGGSSPDRRTYSHTDGDDQYDASDLDYGDDGLIEYRYTYTWDGDRLTGSTTDEGADGVLVYGYAYEYDTGGYTSRVTGYLDGVVTGVSEYDHYADGTAAGVRYDINGDGTFDTVVRYDERGNMVYQSVDSAGDGAVDYLQEWTYDARGRRLGFTSDTGGDGTYQRVQEIVDGYVCGSK